MYNKILAPLDGSKLAECSFSHIKDIAAGCHVAKVVLLTVLEPVMLDGDYWVTQQQVEDSTAEMRKREIDIQKKAETYLAGVSANLKKTGLEVDTVILKENAVHNEADLILDYAKNNDIDLIVMSTHGRSGPARWAFGSVADRVVRHAKCPVLTVAPSSCRVD
jgi:nucleotide-binding universal stress UspA family protein